MCVGSIDGGTRQWKKRSILSAVHPSFSGDTLSARYERSERSFLLCRFFVCRPAGQAFCSMGAITSATSVGGNASDVFPAAGVAGGGVCSSFPSGKGHIAPLSPQQRNGCARYFSEDIEEELPAGKSVARTVFCEELALVAQARGLTAFELLELLALKDGLSKMSPSSEPIEEELW